MMAYIGLIVTIVAFLLFGLTNDEHHRRLRGARPDKDVKRTLKYAAALALCLALFMLAFAYGWGMGLIIWSAETMLAAGLVFLSLNFLPDRKH